MSRIKKRKLLFVFSSSFPRFRDDYSGSFVLPWHRRLKAASNSYKIIYITFDDGSVKRHNLLPVLYLRLPQLFGVRSIGHGYLKAPLTILKKTPWKFIGVFIQLLTAPVVVSVLLRRLCRKFTAYEIALWSHFAVPCSMLVAGFAKRHRLPHIATWHSSDVHLLNRFFILRLLKQHLLKSIDLIQVTSKHLAQKTTGGRARSNMITLPVVPKLFKSPNERKSGGAVTRFAYIGSLHQVKGIAPFLQECLIAATNQEPHFELHIIGEGPQMKLVAKAVETLKQMGWAIFFENRRVAKSKMATTINEFDYLLFPSVAYQGFSEGVPVTAMEAIACGRPVLCCQSGGLPQLFEYGQPGFLYSDQKSLFDALFTVPQVTSEEYRSLQQSCLNWQANLNDEADAFAEMAEATLFRNNGNGNSYIQDLNQIADQK